MINLLNKIILFYLKSGISVIFVFLSFFSSAQSSKLEICGNDTMAIYQDLWNISNTNGFRNYRNCWALNQVAGYIYQEMKKVCDTVYEQLYLVDSLEYKNVIGILGSSNKPVLVIGAHYDVFGNQQGADDNASGVAAILALSRKLKPQQLHFQIQIVAYTLEEPPFFRTQKMGSFVHAHSLFQQHEDVLGMICFDMIGYYSNVPKSQRYPLKLMKWFYGTRGNYITIIQQFGNGAFGRKMKRYIKQEALIKTKSLISPAKVTGVDFSDHLNYIKMGYPAVFITNTAFYRNQNYHQPSDTLATLNLLNMCQVIEEVYAAIIKLNKGYKFL